MLLKNILFSTMIEQTIGGLPSKKLTKVFHVGDMDFRNKSSFSLEGSGLSVSTNPDAWVRIARLGGKPIHVLTNPSGKFLDFHKLNKKQKSSIIQWGIDNGYVEYTVLYNVVYDDGTYSSFDTMENAEYEADDEYEIKIVKKGGLRATQKLTKVSMQTSIDFGNVFDVLVTVFTEDRVEFDGVWWDDTLDVHNYSAPRGVIFNTKLSNWAVSN